MNEQPLYESQIAAKLEQLPLPDMADAIWLRIKDQLDTDMPDGGHTPPPPPPPRPVNSRRTRLGRLGLIVIVAVALLIWLLPEKQQHLPVLSTIADSSVTDTGQLVPGPLPAKLPALKRPGVSLPAVSGTVADTTGVIVPAPAIVLPSEPDTAVIPAPVQPVITPGTLPPQRKDTVTVKKKPRGVPGISDSDYKIVPATKQ